MKIAILTDNSYYSTDTIMEFMYGLKKKMTDITINSTGNGQNGKLIKKIALEAGYDYDEYTPLNKTHNMYTCLPRSLYFENYRAGGKYFTSQKLVDRSDVLVIFSKTGYFESGTNVRYAAHRAAGRQKKVIIIK